MEEQEKQTFKEEILTPIVRKCAHLSIYALLGIFTINFTYTIENNNTKTVICSLVFCILYATTDEIHQYFILGRSAEFRDVVIDSLGALAGMLFVISIAAMNKRIIKQKG